MAKELYENTFKSIITHVHNSNHVELGLALFEYQDILNIETLLNTPLEDGSSLLSYAIKYSDTNTVESLIEWGAEYKSLHECFNLLHTTAYLGKEDNLDYLISIGLDVNTKDESGNTPLHYAAAGQNKSIIKKLIIAGAKVDALNSTGVSPRDVSLSSKSSAEKFLTAYHEVDMMESQFDDTGDQLIPSELHPIIGTAKDQTYFGIDADMILSH